MGEYTNVAKQLFLLTGADCQPVLVFSFEPFRPGYGAQICSDPGPLGSGRQEMD